MLPGLGISPEWTLTDSERVDLEILVHAGGAVRVQTGPYVGLWRLYHSPTVLDDRIVQSLLRRGMVYVMKPDDAGFPPHVLPTAEGMGSCSPKR